MFWRECKACATDRRWSKGDHRAGSRVCAGMQGCSRLQASCRSSLVCCSPLLRRRQPHPPAISAFARRTASSSRAVTGKTIRVRSNVPYAFPAIHAHPRSSPTPPRRRRQARQPWPLSPIHSFPGMTSPTDRAQAIRRLQSALRPFPFDLALPRRREDYYRKYEKGRLCAILFS